MDGWNFHSHIALPLETYGKQCIGQSFYTADEIESGNFVDAMLQILSIEYSDLSSVNDFIESCSIYSELSANEIPKEKSMELFKEFERIFKIKI